MRHYHSKQGMRKGIITSSILYVTQKWYLRKVSRLIIRHFDVIMLILYPIPGLATRHFSFWDRLSTYFVAKPTWKILS